MLRHLFRAVGIPIVNNLHVDENCDFIQEETNNANAPAEDLVQVGESTDSLSDVDNVHADHCPEAVPQV